MSSQNNVSGPTGAEETTAVPTDPVLPTGSDSEAGRYIGTDPADIDREYDSSDGELPAERDEDNLDVAANLPPLTSDSSTRPLDGDEKIAASHSAHPDCMPTCNARLSTIFG